MTTHAQPAPVFIADCNLGRGLFAGQSFAANEIILHFTGPLIGLTAAIAKGATQGNPLQIGPTDYMDLEPPGVYINHSCEPNVGIRDDVILTALRPIVVGEEIRYDYSTTMWEEDASGGGWSMPCRCGSAKCRGVVATLSRTSDRRPGALSVSEHRSEVYRPSGDSRRTPPSLNSFAAFHNRT